MSYFVTENSTQFIGSADGEHACENEYVSILDWRNSIVISRMIVSLYHVLCNENDGLLTGRTNAFLCPGSSMTVMVQFLV